MIIFHGGQKEVKEPTILQTRYNKDFYYGFYCTKIKEQGIRWACRHENIGILNEYEYKVDNKLNVKIFEDMTEEWLEFVVNCRNGNRHNFDIVEGPMANDAIYNYVQNYIDGKITKEAFFALAKFNKPTNQICFNTEKALKCITFVKSYEVRDEK